MMRWAVGRWRYAALVVVAAAFGWTGFSARGQSGVRGTPPHLLAKAQFAFRDARLPELLFRYRARNFPQTLAPEEQARWQAHRIAVLMQGEGGARTFDALFEQLDTLGADADERNQGILEAVYDYAEGIAPELD